MKRRTLISSALSSSVLAFVAPAPAAVVSIPTEQSNQLTPYEAAKVVYDEFPALDLYPEIEFDEPYILDKTPAKIRCKLIALAKNSTPHHNTWIVFYDHIVGFPEVMTIKVRKLKIVRILSKQAHQISSDEEYDVMTKLKDSWSVNGKNIVILKEFYLPDVHNDFSMETGAIFAKERVGNYNPEAIALSRFLSLIVG